MAATHVTFRWLDILEKEFDKAFVDLDILIGKANPGMAGDLPDHSTASENDGLEVTALLRVGTVFSLQFISLVLLIL